MTRYQQPLDYQRPPTPTSSPRRWWHAVVAFLVGLPLGYALLGVMAMSVAHFWPNRHAAPYGAMPLAGLGVLLAAVVVGAWGRIVWASLLLGAAIVMIGLGGLLWMMSGMVS